MRETFTQPSASPRLRLGAVSLLVALVAGASSGVQAESLFRASTAYQAQTPVTYRSLFVPPIARQVGDIVTITISDTVQTQDKTELKLERSRTMTNVGSSPYNQLINWAFGKFSLTRGLTDKLQGPQFSDQDSTNDLGSKAEMSRTTTLTDNITCQVVQVLPSGDLLVQGQKTVQMNKERQDLMVTGIVRPFYLDKNNQISSKQVANLQVIRAGKGVISRQQNDGAVNKIYQFFN
jgi:flagellar L-ring protein precursor FlgH